MQRPLQKQIVVSIEVVVLGMTDSRRIFGTEGEDIAAEFLQGKGMEIVARQARTRFGEIDLVCLDRGEVVFVEVKTRASQEFGPPEAAITRAKFGHMARAAEAYMQKRAWEARPWRLDVVAISMKENHPEILHFPSVDSPAAF